MTDHPAPNPNQPDALVERIRDEILRVPGATWLSAMQAARRVAAVLPEVERHAKADVVRILSGPFDGTEGLDSFTLAWAIAQIEKGDGRG